MRPLLLLLLSLSLSLTACSTRERQVGESCRDASDCTVEAGKLAACLQEECQAVSCFSNSDCPLGSRCSVDDGAYECVEGCETSIDCPAGSNCSAELQCVSYACRSSNLDCELGEVCNPDTGQCESTSPMHCAQCEQLDWVWDDQGTLDFCDDEWLGHAGCGGIGQLCVGFGVDTGTYCALDCSGPDDCPRGYTCTDFPVNFTTDPQLGCPDNQIGGHARVCISDFGCDLP